MIPDFFNDFLLFASSFFALSYFRWCAVFICACALFAGVYYVLPKPRLD